MLQVAQVAVCSEINTKHINRSRKWAGRRIIYKDAVRTAL